MPARRRWPSSCNSVGTRSTRSWNGRSEEHTSELQSRLHLVCRLLLEEKDLALRGRSLLTPPTPRPDEELSLRLRPDRRDHRVYLPRPLFPYFDPARHRRGAPCTERHP